MQQTLCGIKQDLAFTCISPQTTQMPKPELYYKLLVTAFSNRQYTAESRTHFSLGQNKKRKADFIYYMSKGQQKLLTVQLGASCFDQIG